MYSPYYYYDYYSGLCEDAACHDPTPVRVLVPKDRVGALTLGRADLSGKLIILPGTFGFPALVTLDQEPNDDPAGPPPPVNGSGYTLSALGPYFDISVINGLLLAIDPGGSWDPPLELVMDVPLSATGIQDDQLVAAYYGSVAPSGWRLIPSLGSRRSLGVAERDGYFVTGSATNRRVHVLTRHATAFTIFRRIVAGGGVEQTAGTAAPGDSGTPPITAGQAEGRTPTTLVVRASVRSSAGRRLRARGGVLRLRCSAAGSGVTACRITLLFRGRRIGRATATLNGGRASLKVVITAKGRRLLRRARHGLVVVVQCEALSGRSMVATRRTKATLRGG